LEFEGLRIVPSDVPKAGDKFEVQFLRDATKGFRQEIKDANQLAYRGGDPDAMPTPYSTPLGIANNVNAANLASLQDRTVLMGGKENVQGAFSLAASNVGNFHSANKLSLDAQNALYQQLDDTKQSIAGVSLDEEAANLMRFQQSYQAAAQTMQAAQKKFDVLIGAIQ
jgi:flagellar hook-associated protein 1 FlgK